MSRNHGSAPAGRRLSALWGTGTRGGEHRSSALWGTGTRGDDRSRGLWSGGTRGLAVLAVAALALAAPVGASANDGKAKYIAPGLLKKAESAPTETLRVIIQSTSGQAAAEEAGKRYGNVKKRLRSADAVAVDLPAAAISKLADTAGLTVTPDHPVQLLAPTQKLAWAAEHGFDRLWDRDAVTCTVVNWKCTPVPAYVAPKAPAIAIIDSGIDKNRLDFGGRVIAETAIGAASSGSSGDDRGHGTLVAGLAAGSAAGYAGAAPNAPLVSVDVVGADGSAYVSDVIAGIDWVLEKRSSLNIRVANLSLGAPAGRIAENPLNDAVERLWFSGVVVVASAGNYAVDGARSEIRTSPANDPFVITVGAADAGATPSLTDDTMAPFSSWGVTADGFRKPELVAAGRYMVGPVPALSTLSLERPLNVVAPGYMRLSGTSFAAPVVAGAAAQILAYNPTWTPDQVKGALIKTARPLPGVGTRADGFGMIDAAAAAAVKSPPNPNAAVNAYLRPDPAGGSLPVFDEAAWANAAWANAAWANAAWSNVVWGDAAWANAAWANAAWSNNAAADAAWSNASILDAAWANAAWTDAAWSNAAWSNAAWSNNAAGE